MSEQSFTRDPGVETVWVENPETGGVAELSLAALPFWTGRGWQPMDAPPPEVDPTRAHMPPPTAEPEPEPAPRRGRRAAATDTEPSDAAADPGAEITEGSE